MTPLGVALLAALVAPGETPPPAPPAARGADLQLLGDVRRIATRVSELRGEPFTRPPVAVRADDDLRGAAAEIRALNAVVRDRLAARGRAWSDLGLGTETSPRALYLALAADVDGVALDPAGRRLLVAPERLTSSDFEGGAEPNAAGSILMTTGVRPDEPLVGHVLMHLRQLERGGRDWLEETTDRTLARSAWAEGEANLLAMRYLFSGMGLADEIVGGPVDPAAVLDGALHPRALAELAAAEGGLARFVYEEGYAAAKTAFAAGGWAALAAAAAGRTTCRDLLHPDREPVAPKLPARPAAAETPALGLADEDTLGEHAIFVLVSGMTGKDNLALLAADGWLGDRVWRFEPGGGGDPARGVTVWATRWLDAAAAEEFDYALRRGLEARFPGLAVEVRDDGARVLATQRRVYRLERRDAEVWLRVSPAASG